MGGITVTQRFKIAKIVPFRCPRRWPSWNNSNNICSQTLSQIELKPDGRHHSDTENKNCQNCSVPISKMAASQGSHLEILEATSPKPCPIELKLDWEHHSDTEIKNCENRSIPISKIAATATSLKFFKQHLLPNSVRLSRNLMGGITVTQRFKIAKIVRSSIQDGRQGGHLEILQTTSPKPEVRLS